MTTYRFGANLKCEFEAHCWEPKEIERNINEASFWTGNVCNFQNFCQGATASFRSAGIPGILLERKRNWFFLSSPTIPSSATPVHLRPIPGSVT